jgi:hypothetical protein
MKSAIINSMMKGLRKVGATALGLISSLVVLHGNIANAQAQTQSITLTDPLGGSETFSTVATAVAGFLFWDIAMPLSTIMILVGAFQLMTSSGDPEKISQGRKTVMYAAIGFVVALIAGGAVNIIKSFISGSSS